MKNKVLYIFIISIIFIVAFSSINIIYAADNPDSVMNGADKFVQKGEEQLNVDNKPLQNTSNFIYNLLLAIGIVIAVIVGMVIGIKYMTGSVEEKAEVQKIFVGYAVSCFVLFGAFGIWKFVVNILLGI